jgi:hypothetical protein
MTATVATNVLAVDGVHDAGRGLTSIEGPALEWMLALDAAAAGIGTSMGASEEWHPATIAAADLERCGYLDGFPHLTTLATPLRGAGESAADVLTPAACHHVYARHRGERLGAPLRVTTRNTCFRHEADPQPLLRQRSFTMRELVCLGTPDECDDFLDEARAAVTELAARVGLDAAWCVATDPFFDTGSGAALMQRVDPCKHELVSGDLPAIASVNRHRDHFGSAFAITRDAEPCASACAALGLERWLAAAARTHGPDARTWPQP